MNPRFQYSHNQARPLREFRWLDWPWLLALLLPSFLWGLSTLWTNPSSQNHSGRVLVVTLGVFLPLVFGNLLVRCFFFWLAAPLTRFMGLVAAGVFWGLSALITLAKAPEIANAVLGHPWDHLWALPLAQGLRFLYVVGGALTIALAFVAQSTSPLLRGLKGLMLTALVVLLFVVDWRTSRAHNPSLLKLPQSGLKPRVVLVLPSALDDEAKAVQASMEKLRNDNSYEAIALASNSTLSNLATLFSGLPPYMHGVRNDGDFLPMAEQLGAWSLDKNPTLAHVWIPRAAKPWSYFFANRPSEGMSCPPKDLYGNVHRLMGLALTWVPEDWLLTADPQFICEPLLFPSQSLVEQGLRSFAAQVHTRAPDAPLPLSLWTMGLSPMGPTHQTLPLTTFDTVAEWVESLHLADKVDFHVVLLSPTTGRHFRFRSSQEPAPTSERTSITLEALGEELLSQKISPESLWPYTEILTDFKEYSSPLAQELNVRFADRSVLCRWKEGEVQTLVAQFIAPKGDFESLQVKTLDGDLPAPLASNRDDCQQKAKRVLATSLDEDVTLRFGMSHSSPRDTPQ